MRDLPAGHAEHEVAQRRPAPAPASPSASLPGHQPRNAREPATRGPSVALPQGCTGLAGWLAGWWVPCLPSDDLGIAAAGGRAGDATDAASTILPLAGTSTTKGTSRDEITATGQPDNSCELCAAGIIR